MQAIHPSICMYIVPLNRMGQFMQKNKMVLCKMSAFDLNCFNSIQWTVQLILSPASVSVGLIFCRSSNGNVLHRLHV